MHFGIMRVLVVAWVMVCTAGRAETGVLVFADGNRVTGRLEAPGRFASDRFGVVTFNANEAVFEAIVVEAPAAPEGSGASRERAEQHQAGATAPAAAPARSRWHPWVVSLSGFAERTFEDDVRRLEYFAGLKVERPWQEGRSFVWDTRYEYVNKSDRIDKRRATTYADWRRDLSPRWFTTVRPSLEYDGRNLTAEQAEFLGRPRLNYLLQQHQAGVGYRLLNTATLKTAVTANAAYFHLRLFDFVTLDAKGAVLSLENQLKLPWGLEFKQTGRLLYLDVADDVRWENEAELTKHITTDLHLTLRHHYRQEYSVFDTNPIDKLRLLIGVKF